MTLYEELQARGLVAQITDNEIIDLINNGKATFYIGFDCTADSLTAGHFMALTLMKRLQMAGNKPIALIGGGTTMIGDPSGRTDMRKMLTKEDIAHNAACFKKQMEKFIDFSEGKALMLNNADWLLNLNYVELLRDVGACFSVNNMLRAKCYEQRMEKGLSFLEFNYMIMQSYDFYYMFQHYGCNMQFGGDDQWSNMLGGTELIRRKLGKDAYATVSYTHLPVSCSASPSISRALARESSVTWSPEMICASASTLPSVSSGWISAVSYTHLDVYKRQGLHRAVHGLELTPPGVVLLLEQLKSGQRRHKFFPFCVRKTAVQPCAAGQAAGSEVVDTELPKRFRQCFGLLGERVLRDHRISIASPKEKKRYFSSTATL